MKRKMWEVYMVAKSSAEFQIALAKFIEEWAKNHSPEPSRWCVMQGIINPENE